MKEQCLCLLDSKKDNDVNEPHPIPEVSVCTAETLLCAQVSQNPVCATESILCAQVSRRPFFCQRPWCEQKGTKHGI